MRNRKLIIFSTIYGAMIALALIGILLNSEIYLVAIFGICTAALFSIYGQMNAAAREKLSDRAESNQFKLNAALLIFSIIAFLIAYTGFGNLGFSGVMLGTAATCAKSLLNRYTW